jgi:hypothetical protein
MIRRFAEEHAETRREENPQSIENTRKNEKIL